MIKWTLYVPMAIGWWSCGFVVFLSGFKVVLGQWLGGLSMVVSLVYGSF